MVRRYAGLTGVKSFQMGMEHMGKTQAGTSLINQESVIAINHVTVNKSVVLISHVVAGYAATTVIRPNMASEGWLSGPSALTVKMGMIGNSSTTTYYLRGDIYWTVIEFY